MTVIARVAFWPADVLKRPDYPKGAYWIQKQWAEGGTFGYGGAFYKTRRAAVTALLCGNSVPMVGDRRVFVQLRNINLGIYQRRKA